MFYAQRLQPAKRSIIRSRFDAWSPVMTHWIWRDCKVEWRGVLRSPTEWWVSCLISCNACHALRRIWPFEELALLAIEAPSINQQSVLDQAMVKWQVCLVKSTWKKVFRIKYLFCCETPRQFLNPKLQEMLYKNLLRNYDSFITVLLQIYTGISRQNYQDTSRVDRVIAAPYRVQFLHPRVHYRLLACHSGIK